MQHEFCHQVFLSSWFDFIYKRFQKSKFNWHWLKEAYPDYSMYVLSTHRLTIMFKRQNCIWVQRFMPIVLKNILFRWSTQLTDRNKLYKSYFHMNKSMAYSTVRLYFCIKIVGNCALPCLVVPDCSRVSLGVYMVAGRRRCTEPGISLQVAPIRASRKLVWKLFFSDTLKKKKRLTVNLKSVKFVNPQFLVRLKIASFFSSKGSLRRSW